MIKKDFKIPKQKGVYCIQNLINNKIYIGSSINLYRRYYNHNSYASLKSAKGCKVLWKALNKYGVNNFKFSVLMLTSDYYLWEEILINLLNPEYNIATITNGKLQPNIGKKFSKEWSSKLGNFKKHKKEVKEKLVKENKKNACNVSFYKNKKELHFSSWVDAGEYFNIKGSPSSYFTKTKISKNVSSWKGWKIVKNTTQTKPIKLQMKNETFIFTSASKCDKFLNLWRGATSNAIKNLYGNLHGNKVEYL